MGSVNSCWLTKRAADGGYAPRFLGIFVALSFSRFDGESTLPPTAANAGRWADLTGMREPGGSQAFSETRERAM